MSMNKFKDQIEQEIKAVNQEFGQNLLKLGSIDSQWNRGNGSVFRIDSNDLATLSINRHDGFFAVGCDGVKRGINDFLKDQLSLHRENSQNIRYRCEYNMLATILRYYAKQ